MGSIAIGASTSTMTPGGGEAVPEPLTILGALTAAGFGVAFKRRANRTED